MTSTASGAHRGTHAGQALGGRRSGLAGSRAWRQDGGRGGREAGRYLPRYLPVAKRVRLGSEFAIQTALRSSAGTRASARPTSGASPSHHRRSIVNRSTPRPSIARSRLLRAAWTEFDETAARVSAELRLGVRGGGRSRDRIIRHVLGQEAGDFSKRVKRPAELGTWRRRTTSQITETASSRRCAPGTRKASHWATGRSHTCSATRRTTCSTTPGRCRTET